MKTAGFEQLLREHPFFTGLDPRLLRLIVSCAGNVRFDAGRYLFREEQPADHFYLLRHGSVALQIHRPGREPLTVDTLQPGEVLGWSWLLPPYRWMLDARAVRLTRAVQLDAACLRDKMAADHELGYQLYRRFMPIVARRLQAGRIQLLDLYGAPDGTG